LTQLPFICDAMNQM